MAGILVSKPRILQRLIPELSSPVSSVDICSVRSRHRLDKSADVTMAEGRGRGVDGDAVLHRQRPVFVIAVHRNIGRFSANFCRTIQKLKSKAVLQGDRKQLCARKNDLTISALRQSQGHAIGI